MRFNFTVTMDRIEDLEAAGDIASVLLERLWDEWPEYSPAVSVRASEDQEGAE